MTTKERILYVAPGSGNSWKPQLYLEEKGIPYKLINTNWEQKTPEYLKVNPRGQVPVFVDGDVVVPESVAILEYCERAFNSLPEKSLTPSNLNDYGTMLTRLHEYQCNMVPLHTRIWGRTRQKIVKSKDDISKEDFASLKKELNIWNDHLQGRHWLANTFSIADIPLFVTLALFTELLGLDLSKYPNLHSWYKGLWQKESVKKSSPLEYLRSSLGEIPQVLVD